MTHFTTRVALLSVVAAALSLTSCADMAQDVAIARDGVAHFHQQLNQEQYNQIYREAAPAFRKAEKRADFLAFAGAIHRKLGNVKDTTQENFNVNFGTAGTEVVVGYATKFDEGNATEQFTWRIVGQKPILLGYRIDSQALITR